MLGEVLSEILSAASRDGALSVEHVAALDAAFPRVTEGALALLDREGAVSVVQSAGPSPITVALVAGSARGSRYVVLPSPPLCTCPFFAHSV
ncbi:hypothetical protein KIPB_003885, partial [Kipferlia bialata]|eukprot:g3885.t1